ncbi:hypothetical protein JI666_10520 [Bacillus sp. NTK071]|uniref:hypothetical protein n=1 Tax=Bacillus sp. NTK071 TaxID=2802175 RepID=UPI001A8CD66F|nr:hypothetical protein [Bacillus sp. NTK071]MBN8209178.1 hypothetical protein [Bacillus sp. NTK071]
MEDNKWNSEVKRVLFDKEHLTERTKEKMLESILIQHYSSGKKRGNQVLEWLGIAACILLLITTTIYVTKIDREDIAKQEASVSDAKVPYVSAAYMKRATEIAQRETDITNVTYFSKGSNIHIEVMIEDTLSDKKMKELAVDYLKLLSQLYKMENDSLGELWKYYNIDIIIKSNSDYVSLNYFDEEDSSFYLKGSKEAGDSTIDWISATN